MSFKLWDNVLARWPVKPFHFFQAQITNWKINEGIKSYDVYFTEDAETLSNVLAEDLKEPPKQSKWAIMKRPDYVGFEFHHNVRHKGTPNTFGQYEIMEMGILPHHNKYVCHLLKIDPDQTVVEEEEEEEEYYFDVGYVQRLLMDTVTPLVC